MENKVQVPIDKSYRLINYGPVVMVSSANGDKQNIATIAWVSPLSSKPVIVGVAIYQGNFSSKLISQSKEFVVNVPSADQKKQVVACGSIHGDKTEKFNKFGLTPLPGKTVKAPLIAECYAHLECRLDKKIKIGDHFLFTGRVVAAWANTNIIDKKGSINLDKVDTLHHLGGNRFGTLIS